MPLFAGHEYTNKRTLQMIMISLHQVSFSFHKLQKRDDFFFKVQQVNPITTASFSYRFSFSSFSMAKNICRNVLYDMWGISGVCTLALTVAKTSSHYDRFAISVPARSLLLFDLAQQDRNKSGPKGPRALEAMGTYPRHVLCLPSFLH